MDSKDDEGISIDFSKIKKFFKSDDKDEKKIESKEIDSHSPKEITNQKPQDIIKESTETQSKPKSDDGEMHIDFSKIKKLFNRDKPEKKDENTSSIRKEAASSEKKPEDEEISIDFSKIKKFFKSDDGEEKVESSSNTINEAESSKSNNKQKPVQSKDDDEISIDFSKIKKFFKSDEEKPKSHASGEPKSGDKEKVSHGSDEELSIDFGKIKNIFKFKDKIESQSSEDDISVDWKKAAGFFKKYGIVFLILIPIILSIYIRMQAGYLPITDEWAASSVIQGIRSQVSGQINSQYPNLPQQNRDSLINGEVDKFINQNKAQIDEQVKGTSLHFKSFLQDENGKNYMPDIDPYYWARYVENIVDHGYPGDEIRDGVQRDNHQLAPVGRPMAQDMFHSYFLAYFFKFLHIFIPTLTVMRSMFYYPVFISALAVFLVFLIGKKIAGNIGGFFASLMMAVNSAFIGRTLFGHADSDAWVVFFPLLITWLFIEAEESNKNLKIIGLSLLSGFFTGLFTSAWNGWWYIFDFIIATLAITFIYIFLVNFDSFKKNIKSVYTNPGIRKIVLIGSVYVLSSIVFVSFFASFSIFQNSIIGPLGFSSIKAPVTPSLWPNVLTTVAELNEGSINSIINSVGGPFIFLIGLAGLAFATSRKGGIKKFDFIYIIGTILFYGLFFLLRKSGTNISVTGVLIWIMLPIVLRIAISIWNKDKSYDFKMQILLSLWIISTIYASIRGIRFTLLMAPAISVAFGVALGSAYIYLSKWLSKELKIHKIIAASILIVLLLLVYVNPTKASFNASKNDLPIVNDAWHNTLTKIRDDSQEDAIITSWWDFGHHFKYIADRPVTFDGTTQTHQAAHWVGRLFMTNDEREAIGILRLLDCSSGEAFTKLDSSLNNTHLSVGIIKSIIILDEEDALKKLQEYKLDEKDIKALLRNTHCKPPEGYVIASEDMIGKSGVWSHFGSWNFEKADLWHNTRKMPQDEAVQYMIENFNYTKERAENTYFEMQSITNDRDANTWVAPWPGYGGTMSCNDNNEGLYSCSNGMQINLSNYDIFANGQQGIVRPSNAAFPTKEGMFLKTFTGSTIDLGMTITKIGSSNVEVVLSSKELVGSMFTRMFYMNGHGLKYFDLFEHQKAITGGNIYTYKVDWSGRNTTIIEGIIPPPPEPKEDKEEDIVIEEDISDEPIDEVKPALNDSEESNNSLTVNNS